jgi:hypothetical protein
MSSLVLGILAVAIQLVGWAGWLLVVDVTIAPALVSVPVAISAIVFGVKGRNRAREGAPGGRTATIGLKLGVSLIVVTVVGGIVWLSAFASIISHDL